MPFPSGPSGVTYAGHQASMAAAQAITPYVGNAKTFYVGSSTPGPDGTTITGVDASGNGLSPTTPFATLAYATAAATTPCISGRGDTIVVLAGHTEAIATASGINMGTAAAGSAGCDGVTVLGLGQGTMRPTFSWSATNSTWLVAASNATIKNIITKVSIDEVVKMFSVTGAQVTFDGVDFLPAATSLQAIQWLLTTAAADYLTIKNCFHRQLIAANSAQVWIQLVAGTGARIIDNDIDILANASASSYCINGSTATVSTEIARNLIMYRGASVVSVINMVTTSTGMITDNRIGMTSTAGTIDNIITGDTLFKFNNLVMDVAGTASGLVVPAVGTLT